MPYAVDCPTNASAATVGLIPDDQNGKAYRGTGCLGTLLGTFCGALPFDLRQRLAYSETLPFR